MIRIGTCGYSYPDWIGRLYPKGTKASSMLSHYARSFTSVEIDATYYRVFSSEAFASMVNRTPSDFLFTIKVPAAGTHHGLETERIHDDVHLFRRNIAPMLESGKLACALMQFPYSFKPGERAERRIRNLQEALEGMRLTAEFRNSAWQTHETLEFLAERGIGWVNVDEPQFGTMLRPSSEAVGSIGYVRFHGRNYHEWWRGDNRSRYNYLYSQEELEPWAQRIIDIAGKPHVREVLVFFNNCYEGKALRNATLLADVLENKAPDRLFHRR